MNLSLAAAGAVYAAHENIPARAAVPIVAAFLAQFSFYLVPGFPELRQLLERRFSPFQLAGLLLAAALTPYLIYSLPTEVFQFPALLKLAGVCATPAFVFVLAPARGARLCWQDLVVGGSIVATVLSGIFRQIYHSPIAGLRLEVMGQIMLIALGSMAFLSFRRLQGSGYQLRMSWADWKTGIRQFLLFLPVGAALGWGVGFVRFSGFPSRQFDLWMYPFLAAGTFLGMYAVVALAEEFFFRGVLQNLATASLGRPLPAQAIASIAFGIIHLPFRGFPNWRFALLAALAGWFYGQAYRQRQSVVASSITHALVNTAWRLLPPG